MTAALRTVDLGKHYGRQWALQGCTLEVPAGSVAALVGPNVPADRFRALQGIETANFLGLAAVLLGVTVWWVRRRVG